MVLVDLLMAPEDGDDLARQKMPGNGTRLALISAVPLDYLERAAQQLQADGIPCRVIPKSEPTAFSRAVLGLLRS